VSIYRALRNLQRGLTLNVPQNVFWWWIYFVEHHFVSRVNCPPFITKKSSCGSPPA